MFLWKFLDCNCVATQMRRKTRQATGTSTTRILSFAMVSYFTLNFFVLANGGKTALLFDSCFKNFRCDFVEKSRIVQSGGAFKLKVVVNDSKYHLVVTLTRNMDKSRYFMFSSMYQRIFRVCVVETSKNTPKMH